MGFIISSNARFLYEAVANARAGVWSYGLCVGMKHIWWQDSKDGDTFMKESWRI